MLQITYLKPRWNLGEALEKLAKIVSVMSVIAGYG